MKAEFRANRTRAKIHGTAERPRLSVNISNLHVTAQIIDDDKGVTLAYATTVGSKQKGSKKELAAFLGVSLQTVERRMGEVYNEKMKRYPKTKVARFISE